MKILELHLKGYGKFIDRSFHLKSGLNMIYGNNESGKTTLLSFIKAMLYGFSTQKESVDQLPDSKKYVPWEKEVFGGVMTLETKEGKKLRIESDFLQKSTKVYDHTSKEITHQFPYQKREGLKVGEILFEMDRDCFERTAFLSQNQTVLSGKEMEPVFEKIINLSQTGMEDVSVIHAKKALAKALRELGNERTTNRPYNQIKEKINEIEKEYQRVQQERNKMLAYRTRKKEILPQIQSLEKKQKMLKKKQAMEQNLAKQSVLSRVKRRYFEMEQDIIELDQIIHQGLEEKKTLNVDDSITEKDLMSLIRLAAGNAQTNHKDESIHHRYHGLKTKLTLQKAITAILSVSGWMIFGLLVVENRPLAWISGGIGALFLTMFLFLLWNQKKNPQLMALKKEQEIVDKTNAYFKEKNIEKVDHLQEAQEKLDERYISFHQKERITQQIQSEEQRKSHLMEIQKSILEEAGLNSMADLTKQMDDIQQVISENELEEINESEEQIQQNYKALNEELARINGALEAYDHHNDDIVQWEEKRMAYKQKLQGLDQEKKALVLAIETIEKVSSDLQEDLIPKLNEQMSRLLSIITDKKYHHLFTNSEKRLFARDQEQTHPIQAFSLGTIDQMYFSLRMAAGRIFSTKETIPLFLDEPFAFYDENRMKNALDLLFETSKNQQVVLFTCKENEKQQIAKYQKIHVLDLND